uniref:Uncharacterized protein n=1 Tax=Arabidopsis thaliana TaxID=3702 RepID=Q8GWQ0_ARATH|nr:unknown protein [Arabidopsis thaliana]
MDGGDSLSTKFSMKMRILMMLHRQSTTILSLSLSLPLYRLFGFHPDLLQVFGSLYQDINRSTSFYFNK